MTSSSDKIGVFQKQFWTWLPIVLAMMLFILTLTGCGGDDGDEMPMEEPVDHAAVLLGELQMTSSSYLSQVNAAGLTVGNPSISIDTPPASAPASQYATYNFGNQAISMGLWEEAGQSIKDLLDTWASTAGNGATAESYFRLDFNQYAFLIMLGFHAQNAADFNGDNTYQRIRKSSELAVAFWMSQPGGEANLNRLNGWHSNINQTLNNPVPSGTSDEDYFNANIGSIVNSSEAFIYFIQKLEIEAYQNRNQLDFAHLVRGLYDPELILLNEFSMTSSAYMGKVRTAGLNINSPTINIDTPDDSAPASQYANYDFNTEVIRMGLWEETGQPMRNLLDTWAAAAGNGATAESYFRLDFNQWAFMIMLGFHTQTVADSNSGNPYQQIRKSSELGVAYWMSLPGGEEQLNQLNTWHSGVNQSFTSPVPDGMTDEDYFNDNIGAVVGSSEQFIYFIQRLEMEAFANRTQLDFAELIQGL